jgi:hypothetical protein
MIEAVLQNGGKFNPKSFTGLIRKAYYGDVIYVHAGTGSDSANSGTTPDKPVATLGQAITLATANNADQIVLLPGHAEAISSATALTLSKAGVDIVGAGVGSRRPTITLDTAATATINVSAANISIENVVFTANFADITSLFTLTTAKNFTVNNCEFVATAVNMNFLHIVDLAATANAADGLTFTNNLWNEPDAATLSFALIDGAVDRLNISDNVMYTGNATADTAFLLACGSSVLTGVRILRNLCQMVGNAATNTGLLITNSSTTSNGIVALNFLKHLTTSGDLICTASTKIAFHNNYLSGVVDKSGYILPAADS